MKGPPLVNFVADIHMGNPRWRGGPMSSGLNGRGRMIHAALADVWRQSGAMGCANVALLGDIFDSSNPTPHMLNAVMATAQEFIDPTFSKTPGDVARRVWALRGNHDMDSEQPGDHALSLLSYAGVEVVEERIVHRFDDTPGPLHELWLIPFRTGNAREWLPNQVQELSDHARKMRAHTVRDVSAVLGLHVGIIDAATPPWLRDAPDAIELDALVECCARAGVGAVVAGNWHEHRAWKREFTWPGGGVTPVQVMQVGALVPTGFNNPGLTGYGSMVSWDGEELTMRPVGDGPRFVVVHNAEEWAALITTARISTLTVAGVAHGPPISAGWVVEGGADDLERARREAQQSGEILNGWEVVPGVEGMRARAVYAASAARGMPSIEAGVRAYVDGLDIGDLTAPVCDAVLDYIGTGAP